MMGAKSVDGIAHEQMLRGNEVVSQTEKHVRAPYEDNGAAVSLPIANNPTPLSSTRGLGWLPALSLVSAFGLLLLAFTDNGARANAGWAEPLFWVGLLILFMPVAARLVSSDASRQERIGLIVMLGIALYLVKVLQNPLAFTYHDELGFWRATDDVIQSHHLFHQDPLGRIYPLYPGLENVTTALVNLGGLSIFGAGVVALGVARLVLVLALYLFYEQVGRSARVAGIAALLYMTNPNFLFFDAQFAYESLALPLTALALFAAVRRGRAHNDHRGELTLVAVFAIGSVVVAHHLTAYALAVFLLFWAGFSFVHRYEITRMTGAIIYWRRGEMSRRQRWRAFGRQLARLRTHLNERGRPRPGGLALLAFGASLAWLMLVGSATFEYIFPVLNGAVAGFIQLVSRETGGKIPFRNATGNVDPLWERLTGFASVGLILLGLPFGLWRMWRRRASAVTLLLVGATLAYPASLALRLTQEGTETSNRASEFLFVGIAFVLAVGIVEGLLPRRVAWRRSAPFFHREAVRFATITSCAAVIFLGGVIVGWAPYARLPGPYLVAAASRSIEPQGVMAAEWAKDVLGPGNRIAADITNELLMGSYGYQDPQGNIINGPPIPPLFYSTQFGQTEREIIRGNNIQYLVVDRRNSNALPLIGQYFQHGPEADTTPLDPTALAKFDNVKGISRTFDSGDIIIYDTRFLLG